MHIFIEVDAGLSPNQDRNQNSTYTKILLKSNENNVSDHLHTKKLWAGNRAN